MLKKYEKYKKNKNYKRQDTNWEKMEIISNYKILTLCTKKFLKVKMLDVKIRDKVCNKIMET